MEIDFETVLASPLFQLFAGALLGAALSLLASFVKGALDLKYVEKRSTYSILASSIRWSVKPNNTGFVSKSWIVAPTRKDVRQLHDSIPYGVTRSDKPNDFLGGPGLCTPDDSSGLVTMNLIVPLSQYSHKRKSKMLGLQGIPVNWTYEFPSNPFNVNSYGDFVKLNFNRYNVRKIQVIIDLPEGHRRIKDGSITIKRARYIWNFEPGAELTEVAPLPSREPTRVLFSNDQSYSASWIFAPRLAANGGGQIFVVAYEVPPIKVRLESEKRIVEGWVDHISWEWEPTPNQEGQLAAEAGAVL